MQQEKLKTHSKNISEIKAILEEWKQHKNKREIDPEEVKASNTIYHKNYKKSAPPLPLRKLNQVIEFNAFKKTLRVEPGVTMEELVDAVLPYGFIPKVVPEFKGITVGGAINGGALESTSHLHGQFNDCCVSYEVLLGNGEVITASLEENRELFLAIPGSYGTLGILLSVELELMRASPFVELTYRRENSLEKGLDLLKEIHEKELAIGLEAILYNLNKIVLIATRWVEGKGGSSRSYLKSNADWFYSVSDKISSTLQEGQTFKEVIPIKDYLFRHDRGAFWMGGYLFNLPLLSHFLLHKILKRKPPISTPKNPPAVFRSLFGRWLGSQTLYHILHHNCENWFKEHIVIQDFYLPFSQVQQFIEKSTKKFGIFPLWLCPIQPAKHEQLFSPHSLKKKELVVDVGIYGMPSSGTGCGAVKDLETWTYEMGGRKMFYTHTYLTSEEFWKNYSFDKYMKLRDAYALNQVFPHFYEKILAS